jgi:hypothetical protein
MGGGKLSRAGSGSGKDQVCFIPGPRRLFKFAVLVASCSWLRGCQLPRHKYVSGIGSRGKEAAYLTAPQRPAPEEMSSHFALLPTVKAESRKRVPSLQGKVESRLGLQEDLWRRRELAHHRSSQRFRSVAQMTDVAVHIYHLGFESLR